MKTRPMAAVAELRPRHLAQQADAPTATAGAPAFTLTVEALAAVVTDAVSAALAAAAAPSASARGGLLSVQAMAAHLGCSRSKVNAMRLEGCPAVRLGAIYRFEPEAVLAWLKARGDQP